MPRTSAPFAADLPRAASVRLAFALSFPRTRALASGLASIISNLRRREERRLSAQDEALKNLHLLQVRKAILAHRKEELIAQIAGERVKHRGTSLLIAELQAVTTEILSIG